LGVPVAYRSARIDTPRGSSSVPTPPAKRTVARHVRGELAQVAQRGPQRRQVPVVVRQPFLTGRSRRFHPVQPDALAQQRPDALVADVRVEHDGEDFIQQRLTVLPDPTPLGQRLDHLEATTADRVVLDALDFLRANRHRLGELIPDHIGGVVVDLSFARENWQKTVRDHRQPGKLIRRHFEMCVFTWPRRSFAERGRGGGRLGVVRQPAQPVPSVRARSPQSPCCGASATTPGGTSSTKHSGSWAG